MLELKNISKAFGGKKVLEDFSFSFPDTGVYAVLGASGCGKTTLFRIIAGLEKPDAGEVIMDKNARLTVVFQEDRLLTSLNVRGNVLIALGKTEDDRKLSDECLRRCGLLDVATAMPDRLSGGMKRRVAIARAMAFGGDILLLDEPFKGLDDATKKQVSDFVFENSKSRLTIMITHDEEEAAAYASHSLRLGVHSL